MAKNQRPFEMLRGDTHPALASVLHRNRSDDELRRLDAIAKTSFRIYERDGFRCAYCGHSSYEHGAVLHLDHIIPRSAGGLDIAGNLITACAKCNCEKKDSIIKDAELIIAEASRRNQAIGLSDNQVIKLIGRPAPHDADTMNLQAQTA
jgi:hypothetical protein